MLNTIKRNLNEENADKIINIINTNSDVSLGLIDYFVTNYSKNYSTTFNPDDNNKRFSVHTRYKTTLKGYQKLYFDPFCRFKKFNCELNGVQIYTAISQLNFLIWVISNGILNYIKEHLKDIQKIKVRGKTKVTKDKVIHTVSFDNFS